MRTGGWLVIAAIAGAVFTSFGALLNDQLARLSENRRAQREANERRQQWDREDRIRRDEKKEAEQLQVREARARAYKAFVSATTFPLPLAEDQQAERVQELNERYVDVLLYSSNWLEQETEDLNARALQALSEPTTSAHSDKGKLLQQARSAFWIAVRDEGRDDYAHS
jgi:hypothetical protein